ncbi:hypothetical protein [Streptosporangium saharense]|uniref:Uncharacterized protein n=1 Tax=Streptosporangium saharense TaxID=1706840 RepID=A0A7W7QQU6_9ACTN|nr:hypothetical protein [Streptosporangium saharense]MBB4917426.1 hypothetical protein [Streptosporangium saharense]
MGSMPTKGGKLAAELGLTPRCVVLTALAVIALALAVTFAVPALYGVAAVTAFVAGTVWDRRICCDECLCALEEG